MSVYRDILDAVKRRVEDGVSDAVPVVIRRRPQYLATDTLPLVIVSPDSTGEKADMQTFQAGITWAYPVVVVLFTKGNRELTISATEMDLREAVRDELFQMPPLEGQTGIYDLDIELSGPFNMSNPQNTTETDAFRVIYFSSETRKA